MAAQTPRLTSFHLFNRFPKEIRDAIWEFAARDDRPGVHFFNVNFDPEPITNPQAYRIFGFNPDPSIVDVDEDEIPDFYYNAFKPADSFHSTFDPSTYLIDSGMWTACHESRDVMLRLSRKREHCCPIKRELDLITESDPGPFAQAFRENCVGYFYGTDTEEKQYFTVLTHDLMCIQLPDPTTSIHFTKWFNMPFVQPFFVEVDDLDTPGTMMGHVAFEYNPDWKIPRHEDLQSLLLHHDLDHNVSPNTDTLVAEAVADLTARATLWFIDYRIKRGRGLPGSQDEGHYQPVCPDRVVFYGNRCRLVEVGPTDKEWELCLGSGGDERRVPFKDHIRDWLVEGWEERDRNPFAFQDALYMAGRLDVNGRRNLTGYWSNWTTQGEMDWEWYKTRGADEGVASMGVLAFEQY